MSTIQELEDENNIIIGRDGKPLTKKDREFLIAIKKFEECYGTGTLLAFRTFLQLIIEKKQKLD